MPMNKQILTKQGPWPTALLGTFLLNNLIHFRQYPCVGILPSIYREGN